MGEFVVKGIVGTAMSFILAAITLAIANGGAHQHWGYWPVFGIWMLIVFAGVVMLEVHDGDIDLL